MISRVLVAIDSADDLPLVDAACRIADEEHACLELVGGIAHASFTVGLVACPRVLNHELELYSRALLSDAVARVPADIPVVWRQVQGCARRRLVRDAEADRDSTSVVLVGRLPWWARGALRRRLSRLVTLADAPPAGPERPVALRGRAGSAV